MGQARAHLDVVMPGYTFERASRCFLAHHFLAYVEMLDRDRTRLHDCRQRFNVMPLGSGLWLGRTIRWIVGIRPRCLNFRRSPKQPLTRCRIVTPGGSAQYIVPDHDASRG